MMTCKEVSTLVSTGGLSEAPLVRRLGVLLHLAMCRRCRAFRRQVQAIAHAARTLNRAFEGEPPRTFETKVMERLLV